MDKIAVLIPCYNEEKAVAQVINDWKKELPEAVIYVYDNNSTDDTVGKAKSAGAVVRFEHQQGKGNVIRRMFREISAECYVMVDGDGTYSADKGREMADLVLNDHVDMVIGDRLSSTYFTENKRAFHNFGNKMVRSVINSLFDTEIKDVMTGLRAFSYQFVKTFPVLSQGFEIETEMTIHAVDKKMEVKNVIIDYKDREYGSSKLNTFKDGFKVLRMIIRLYRDYRPMRFFGIIGLILMIISTAFFVPVFADYLETGTVERFPTLIVCGFAVIAALLSFFSGQILKTMINKDKQAFEFRMQITRMMYERELHYENENKKQ